MDLQSQIKQFENAFNNTKEGKAYSDELKELDDAHKKLKERAEKIGKSRRANRRDYKSLEDERELKRNTYVMNSLANLNVSLLAKNQPPQSKNPFDN